MKTHRLLLSEGLFGDTGAPLQLRSELMNNSSAPLVTILVVVVVGAVSVLSGSDGGDRGLLTLQSPPRFLFLLQAAEASGWGLCVLSATEREIAAAFLV